jgi:hypothetical protein
VHVRGVHERVGDRGPEGGLDLELELRADARLDVGAQRLERVELRRGARELVVDGREHLLLQLLDGDVDRLARVVGELDLDRARVVGRGADEAALDLLEQAPRAELYDEVALDVPARLDHVDDDDVALARRAPVDGRELSDGRAQRLDLRVDCLGRHVRVDRRHLKRLPVGCGWLGLHRDGGREAPAHLVGSGQLVVVGGLLDRADAGARGGVPEPAADVALDGLAVDALAAELGHQHRHRHLALAETGDSR